MGCICRLCGIHYEAYLGSLNYDPHVTLNGKVMLPKLIWPLGPHPAFLNLGKTQIWINQGLTEKESGVGSSVALSKGLGKEIEIPFKARAIVCFKKSHLSAQGENVTLLCAVLNIYFGTVPVLWSLPDASLMPIQHVGRHREVSVRLAASQKLSLGQNRLKDIFSFNTEMSKSCIPSILNVEKNASAKPALRQI